MAYTSLVTPPTLQAGAHAALFFASLPATMTQPSADSLRQRPLYEQVAERLRELIFSRQLEPGAWVDELQLAAQLGISRTPLREALKVLAVEGLVTMKPRRGAYVTEMSLQDVQDVYRLLGLLESDAAAEVAERHDPLALQELAQIHAVLAGQVEQREAFFATNERFHLRLLELAGNRWRMQLVQDLRKVMKLNRHHSLLKDGRLQASLDEHEQLMQALDSGQGEQARQAMTLHFRNGLSAATAGH